VPAVVPAVVPAFLPAFLPPFLPAVLPAGTLRPAWPPDDDERWRAARPDGQKCGRGDTIRTCDFQFPKLALYQAELRPGGEPHHCRR
jgi:hypothetical protein